MEMCNFVEYRHVCAHVCCTSDTPVIPNLAFFYIQLRVLMHEGFCPSLDTCLELITAAELT